MSLMGRRLEPYARVYSTLLLRHARREQGRRTCLRFMGEPREAVLMVILRRSSGFTSSCSPSAAPSFFAFFACPTKNLLSD